VAVLGLVACGEPTPQAPVDARAPAIDAEIDAALPAIQISAGALQFEQDAADAGPDAAPVVAPAAAKPKPRARKPKARARPKARSATGAAMQTIRAHMGDVQHCYGRVALKDPTIQGRITMQWTLGRTGMPTATAVLKDTLKDKSVAKCLRTKARGWKFPPPDGGIGVITYPFDLRVQ
jgi:hypothetical protein